MFALMERKKTGEWQFLAVDRFRDTVQTMHDTYRAAWLAKKFHVFEMVNVEHRRHASPSPMLGAAMAAAIGGGRI